VFLDNKVESDGFPVSEKQNCYDRWLRVEYDLHFVLSSEFPHILLSFMLILDLGR
jgi:hypothetical protein